MKPCRTARPSPPRIGTLAIVKIADLGNVAGRIIPDQTRLCIIKVEAT